MKVIVVGAGPRGIAVAIEAKYRGYECALVDRDPISSWRYAAPDMVMRSPLSFDLVYPGSPAWGTSSLIRYIHPDSIEPDWGECMQRGIEYMEERCTRSIFISYATHTLDRLDIPVIRERVVRVGSNQVVLGNGEYIYGDVVVIATGLSPITDIPHWVVPVTHKLVTAQEVVGGLPNGTYAVIGGGQSGAEYCEYIARQGHKVYWVVNGKPRVRQYPVPSYIDWGIRSALSGYYRTIPTPQMRQEYISQVKAWQPSITPIIDIMMRQRGDAITILEGPGTREGQATWDTLHRKVDGVLLCTGNKPAQVEYINPPMKVNGKLVLDNFMASNGIYHTGLLAMGYDGPRQGSLVSAGITAREIFNHYEGVIDANMDS